MTNAQVVTTPNERSLPRRDALLYASSSFAGNVVTRVIAAWLFYFYVADQPDAGIPRRVSVVAMGAVLTITSLIESFDDPLIGYWSDRTRSRWGRRIPFIALATPPWALFFFLLWTPPVASESAVNVVYLFTVLLMYHLFGTLSGGPAESLLPEIAPGNADRVFIVMAQVAFGTIGAAAALVGSGPIIDLLGFQTMAAIVAVLILVNRYLSLAGAWRHARRDVAPAQMNVVQAFTSTFRNDQFLCFLPTFVLFNMGVTLLTASLPFFVEAVIQAPAGQVGTYTSLLAAVPVAAVPLALPVVYRLALRRGKAWVYSHAMLLGACFFPLLFFMGFVPGIPPMAQAIDFLFPAGLAMTGVFVFPNALMADVIDYDALRTGMRREAIYYGTQNVIEKIAVAMHAAILAGLLLVGGTAQNPTGIRLVGPIAGVSILAGYLIFRCYRLPDTVTWETLHLD
jgi:GPH family glycoside/pentoside/hexuronide:cation symporter